MKSEKTNPRNAAGSLHYRFLLTLDRRGFVFSPKPASPHVIRLRGPWNIRPLSRQGAAGAHDATCFAAGFRQQMPADWSAALGCDFCGEARYQRFFHRPTGIDAGERVWLVCHGAIDQAVVVLNGKRVGEFAGPSAAARFDVTGLLAPRNELLIDVTFLATLGDGEPAEDRCGGLTGEVRLEIFPRPDSGKIAPPGV